MHQLLWASSLSYVDGNVVGAVCIDSCLKIRRSRGGGVEKLGESRWVVKVAGICWSGDCHGEKEIQRTTAIAHYHGKSSGRSVPCYRHVKKRGRRQGVPPRSVQKCCLGKPIH